MDGSVDEWIDGSMDRWLDQCSKNESMSELMNGILGHVPTLQLGSKEGVTCAFISGSP